MAITVQTNLGALSASRNLNINQNSLNSSIERLSSGFRINRAADDAAGFAIAAKLTGQNARLQAASQNALQATSLVQMADSSANAIQNMLTRLQSLATQAASAQNSSELTKLDNERTKLETQITKIANSTNFNGVNLLNGQDAAKTANDTSGAFTVGTLNAVTNAQVTTFQNSGLNASYTVATDAAGVVTVTGSDGSTGTGATALGTVTTSAATADTGATLNQGGADVNATALVTSIAFASGGFNTDTTLNNAAINVQVDQFGSVQVLDSNNAIIGTAAITGADVATGAVNATTGTTANGANTHVDITQLVATVSGTDVATAHTSGTTSNVQVVADLGTDGLTISFHEQGSTVALSVTGSGAGTSLAVATGAFTVNAAAPNLLLTALTTAATITDIRLSNGVELTVTTGNSALDTTNVGSGVGGSITLSNGSVAASQTFAVTLNQGAYAGAASTEKLTLTLGGGLAELGGLAAGFNSAGILTETGSQVSSSTTASASQNITLGDNTVVNVTYATSGGTVAGAGSIAKSSGTATTAYAAALDFQVGSDNNVDNTVSVDLRKDFRSAGLGITGDLTSQKNAKTYIDTIKAALNTLATNRASIGSTQNQLGFVNESLATSIEQVSSAISIIKDANLATETAAFSKNQILVQAGTSMLAQANTAAQNVLRLFQ